MLVIAFINKIWSHSHCKLHVVGIELLEGAVNAAKVMNEDPQLDIQFECENLFAIDLQIEQSYLRKHIFCSETTACVGAPWTGVVVTIAIMKGISFKVI
jgi:hypothetical protein